MSYPLFIRVVFSTFYFTSFICLFSRWVSLIVHHQGFSYGAWFFDSPYYIIDHLINCLISEWRLYIATHNCPALFSYNFLPKVQLSVSRDHSLHPHPILIQKINFSNLNNQLMSNDWIFPKSFRIWLVIGSVRFQWYMYHWSEDCIWVYPLQSYHSEYFLIR